MIEVLDRDQILSRNLGLKPAHTDVRVLSTWIVAFKSMGLTLQHVHKHLQNQGLRHPSPGL